MKNAKLTKKEFVELRQLLYNLVSIVGKFEELDTCKRKLTEPIIALEEVGYLKNWTDYKTNEIKGDINEKNEF